MTATGNLEGSLLALMDYIEEENYAGYDPYDVLSSALFRLPLLKSNSRIRFYAQQLVKRSPLNLRKVLLVPKGTNPVTLGLCIEAYANLSRIYPERKHHFNLKIELLIARLTGMIPAGFHGACWGYDFDWEARYVTIPAYQPTIVATGIICNSLFKTFRITGNEKAAMLCESAAGFILEDINRTYADDGSFCFSYSPFDKLKILNASMKGVRTLSQVYSLNKKENIRVVAEQGASFVTKHQREDGAWLYSSGQAGKWIDNYHTGYILDCLDEYMHCTGDRSCEPFIRKGYYFYRSNFFNDNGLPKLYDNRQYPVDATAAAQSILTLVRFDDTGLAGKVAQWMINNMQDKKGFFYYRKYSNTTMRTSFMRWSNAWMFAAFSELMNATALNR